ncbi:MAG: DUF1926 domain-containing protein [Treponema sp.]|jgi:hypothetical protein|nr:DUF1926 domain-containing protein [Treponema sp.]
MAAAKINLVLGSHAHVPYGADAAEFEKVYTSLLRPFVSGLYKYPHIQAALHYSGVLLHWVERSHPELLMLIEDMVVRKQVEMLGGGFYEPMLPIIPLQDKIGQIELLTTYLRKQFGKRPQGCWIPAFAWEQGLVSPLAACGMGFTFLGEKQFALAGGNEYVPCICEDQGKLITVFPVLQPPAAALDGKISTLLSNLLENYSKRHPEKTEFVVSIFPSKIKENAWERFFEELSRCESFAETVIPGKLIRTFNGLQKLYIPDSSDAAEGMPPRRFTIAHPEAGWIHAKMVFTNVLINQLRGDKSRKLSAHEELWKAQGDALFRSTGAQGLHNNALRNAAYSALLGAERVSREKSKFVPSLVPFDFNMDGAPEWLFQDTKINCYVQSTGGGIFELDYLPKTWNYLDTCGGRFAFADRLLPSALKPENLKYGAIEGARLCRSESYELVELDKVRRRLCLALRRLPSGENGEREPSEKAIPLKTSSSRKPPRSLKTRSLKAGSSMMPPSFGNIEIEKNYSLKKDAVCAGYIFTNCGTVKETFQFAPEIDLSLPGEGDAFTRFFACKSAQADAALTQPLLRAADGIKIHDIKNEVQITLTANHPFDGKISPIHIPDDKTGAQLYQAFCIMPLFPVSLEPGGKWELEFTLRFSH